MRQSQAEIKAIEAELRSIRADRPSTRPSVTLLNPSDPSTPTSGSSPAKASPAVGLAESLAVRSPQPTTARSSAKTTSKPRSLECFPLPNSPAASRTSSGSAIKPATAAARSVNRRQVSQSALRQLKQTQTEFRQAVTPSQLQSLEVQVQRINQLAELQETAILQFKALAAEVESRTPSSRKRRSHSPAICEYVDAAVPLVERDDNGVLVLTTRSVDLYRAEREAAATAQVLRQRAAPRRSGASWLGKWLWQPVWSVVRAVALVRPLRRLAGRRPRPVALGDRTLERPFTLIEGVKLVAAAALVRVALDFVVAAYPALWLPSIAIMVAPAAIAIYRSTVAPQAGFVWGYRLFSIMIGLLLGGRL